jgi:hypothetical protein
MILHKIVDKCVTFLLTQIFALFGVISHSTPNDVDAKLSHKTLKIINEK